MAMIWAKVRAGMRTTDPSKTPTGYGIDTARKGQGVRDIYHMVTPRVRDQIMRWMHAQLLPPPPFHLNSLSPPEPALFQRSQYPLRKRGVGV